MAAEDSSKPCSVSWFEIYTEDAEKTASFYQEVLGWKHSPFTQYSEKYLGVTSGPQSVWMDSFGGIDGGIAPLSMSCFKKVQTLNTAAVPSLDATIAKVEEAGGRKIWGPRKIPMVGMSAYVEDNMGLAIGLMQFMSEEEAAQEMPDCAPPPRNEDVDGDGDLGRIVHFDIVSEDPNKSVDFYRHVFGWKMDEAEEKGIKYWMCHTGEGKPMTPPNMMPYINGCISGRTLASGYKLPVGMVNFAKVANTSEVAAKVEKAGGKKVTGFEMPGCIFTYFEDPEGTIFGTYEDAKKAKSADA